MNYKKITIWVTSVVLFLAVVVGSFLLGSNGKLFASGGDLRTQKDVETAYNDGYDKALGDKAEYTKTAVTL